MGNILYFVTGNPGKVIGPAKSLAAHGIELKQRDIGIPEIQADTAWGVAFYKAVHAFNLIQTAPLMVNDSALHIRNLKGFPGPYVKPVIAAIGLEGLLRLMAPWPDLDDRRCTFTEAWALMAPRAKDDPVHPTPFIMTFHRDIQGRLATEIRGSDSAEQKSALWKLFIPKFHERTLAEMDAEELAEHRWEAGDVYADIAAWLNAWYKQMTGR